MSEKQFRHKRKSMENEIRGSQLVPESEFLYRRKVVTDNIVYSFEFFKHGNTEESIQVSNCKKKLKGEKDFENIHENYVLALMRSVMNGWKEGGVVKNFPSLTTSRGTTAGIGSAEQQRLKIS